MTLCGRGAILEPPTEEVVMSQVAMYGPRPAPAPDVRGLQGVGWFAFMVAMWSAFFTLLVAAPDSLADGWHWLTGLPLAAEIVMWILLLPWALGLAVWQSSWQEWLRLLVVAVVAAGWTLVSAPRPKR
jgi:hypothetical protein